MPKTMNDSPLFKSLKKATIPEQHDALLKALTDVQESWRCYDFDWREKSLARAFTWANAPQGFDFWNEYAQKMHDAGFPEQAGF